MRLVVLESPYAGDVEANVAYAGECIKDCLARGEAPIASHLLFTQFLNDNDPLDRRLGILAGHAWIQRADAVVVYCDRGISSGMSLGIAEARRLKVPVEHRRLYAS